jgi:hypothetical protein
MITKKLPKSAFYNIPTPKNLYSTMHHDVKLLYDSRSYVTCTLVILCCIDALAAGKGKAAPAKFEAFAKKHFPELCTGLDGTIRGKSGEKVLYAFFRNGFAHLFTPKPGFVIAEDHELDSRYAGRLEFEGVGKFISINADRLARDFLRLIERLSDEAAQL